MQFDRVRRWSGSAKDLTEEIQHQTGLLNILIEPPALRTIRLWRSKKLLSQPKGKKFGFRQILEGLATALLLKRGWTLASIGEVLPNFSDADMERQILAESENRDPNWSAAIAQGHSFAASLHNIIDTAEDAVVLLAQGILKQYTRVLNQEIVRQNDSMPSELYRAMCKLGRLYIEEGTPDKAACVHTVLDRARHSFRSEDWRLKVFSQNDFRFSDVVLIDPDLYVPTSDCTEVAQANGGWGKIMLLSTACISDSKHIQNNWAPADNTLGIQHSANLQFGTHSSEKRHFGTISKIVNCCHCKKGLSTRSSIKSLRVG